MTGVDVHMDRGQWGSSGQVAADLRQAPGTANHQVLNDTGFGHVVRRKEQLGTPGGPGGQGHGEGPADGPEAPLQPHLAQDHGPAEVGFRELAAGHQKAQGDRQIQRGTILAYVRGSKIYRDPSQWKIEPGVGQGSGNPLPALLDRAIRQPDGREGWQPAADIDLNFDRECVDTQDGGGSDACEHDQSGIGKPPE